jgi:hypothetical protein
VANASTVYTFFAASAALAVSSASSASLRSALLFYGIKAIDYIDNYYRKRMFLC